MLKSDEIIFDAVQKNDEKPLVSIVIPSYNHAHFLGQALQSVLDQTYSKWEVIVVDNYSSDGTRCLIKKYLDPRISFHQINNHGVIARSRNVGIGFAKGDWIAFLDSDDWWENDKLETCLLKIDNQTDLVYHDLKIFSQEFRLWKPRKIKSRQLQQPITHDLLVKGNGIATSSVMVRTTLIRSIGGMDERPEMAAAEDYNTWLKLSKLTTGFKYCAHSLGHYRIHGQASSKKDMTIPWRYAVAEFIHELSPSQKLGHEADVRYAKARFLYTQGDYPNARADLLFALKHGKRELKPKIIFMLLVTLIFSR
jgi:glycosyltransferase involved in cell wall biosynthesis